MEVDEVVEVRPRFLSFDKPDLKDTINKIQADFSLQIEQLLEQNLAE
jgi:hypothetical protein